MNTTMCCWHLSQSQQMDISTQSLKHWKYCSVKHMIKLKYVPCGKSSLYRMLQNHNQGKPILNSAWSVGGRPRVLEDTAISSIVQRLSNDVGRTYGRKEVNGLIIAQQNQMLNDAGNIPLSSDYQLKPTTLQN